VVGDATLDPNVLLQWCPVSVEEIRQGVAGSIPYAESVVDIPFVEDEVFRVEGGVAIFKFC
jgi:hypothetical protein